MWDLTSVSATALSAISISQDSRRAMRGRTCTFETLRFTPKIRYIQITIRHSELYTARATALQLHAPRHHHLRSSIRYSTAVSCADARNTPANINAACNRTLIQVSVASSHILSLSRCRQPSGEARGYGRANAAERMHDNNNTALCIRAHARLLACCSAQLRSKPDSDLMA